MGSLKTLASDTVVYGASTILGRLLSWLLTPYYAHVILQSEVGMVTTVYTFIAVLLVVVSLGFETGYFKFVNADNKDSILGTLSNAVFGFGTFFILLFAFFGQQLSPLCGFGSHGVGYGVLFSSIVMLDAYNALFFAELRSNRQSRKYAILRFVQVLVTVVLTVIFLTLVKGHFAQLDSVSLILLANLLSSVFCTLVFLPRIVAVFRHFVVAVFRRVLLYSLPLVGMGCIGMLNQNVANIMIPNLSTSADPMAELGIYSASFKIGILMAIFTQSFRLAFEPFIFKNQADREDRTIYGRALEVFVYFGLFIFAAVMLFRGLIWSSGLLPRSYEAGNDVIPFTLLGQLFFGVYYSLSMWYKLISKTYFGVIMSGVGLVVNIALCVVLIPRVGFVGAGVAQMIGYMVMMLLSFILEHKYYPVQYPFSRILLATFACMLFVFGACEANVSVAPQMGSYGWLLFSSLAMLMVVALIGYLSRNQIKSILSRRARK